MNKEIINYVNEQERKLDTIFKKIDNLCLCNSIKVIEAFKQNLVSENHFHTTTGYGYNDLGRDTVEKVYADIFKAEDALVRSQFISGTHAISTTLFAMLRPNDVLLSITGKPYDTLDPVIGITENPSSLQSYRIKYKQIELVNDDFDYKKIANTLLKQRIKVVHIQRSKGYSTRKSINMDKMTKVIKEIRKVDKEVIIMVDNCYCEFVNVKEPTMVGADIVVGSLIKNLGGGIATNGGYVVGKKKLIKLVSERLNVAGQAKEVGPSQNMNKAFLQGLYLAPSVVANSLKIATLTSKVLEDLGYQVEPKYQDERVDIVQNIIFNDPQKLAKYCNIIQSMSPIDSYVKVMPEDMPGYDNKIIMASGSFTSGSSIELSCDGPLRKPFIAYQQGGLTYEYGKLAVIKAATELIKK